MIEANIASVSNALAILSSNWRLLERGDNLPPDAVRQLNPSQFAAFKVSAERLRDFSEEISAPVTKDNSISILRILEGAENNCGCLDAGGVEKLVQYLYALQNAFPAEMEAKKAFIINNRYSDFYVGGGSPLHFGEQALGEYHLLTPEVREASNCIALGRWTASVMHLMRAMEIPLHALSRGLGHDPNLKPNWGRF